MFVQVSFRSFGLDSNQVSLYSEVTAPTTTSKQITKCQVCSHVGQQIHDSKLVVINDLGSIADLTHPPSRRMSLVPLSFELRASPLSVTLNECEHALNKRTFHDNC